jgi:hypothetical protein
VLALLALVVLSQSSGPMPRFNKNAAAGVGYAYFEFAPASGAGMTAPCACTTPTGAKGETLTFTRASSGTCLKGGTTSGIANGDMVTCSSNQPRVMPGGDGSGGVGLLVEGARTNSCLRSQECDNAAWTKENGGAPNPGAMTITADNAVAPDGTTTAERLQIPASSGTGYSDFYQGFSVTSGAATSCSAFVKGNASSGTTDICVYDGATWSCSDCAYVSATWSRCTISDASGTATSRFCKLGNNSNQNGGVARSAADMFAWGLQGEEGAFASSYIKTEGATVTRAVESPTFVATASIFNTTGSAAATVLMGDATAGGQGAVTFAGTGRMLGFNFGGLSTGKATVFDTTTVVAQATAGSDYNLPHRIWSTWSGSSMTVTNVTDGFAGTGAFDGSMQGASTSLEVGNNVGGGGPLNGVIKGVCLDPGPGRCR